MSWLLDRLPARVKQKNNFVFLGAVHWPRGLALICEKSKPQLAGFYDQVQPKGENEEADNQVFFTNHDVFALFGYVEMHE